MEGTFSRFASHWWWKLLSLALGGIVFGAGRELGAWAAVHWGGLIL
nr:hypothetical protein KitaXyl93_76830 [Kitasatospora sp. Xyl93]